ncbi:MAG: hypothetical protein ACKPKO_32335 [Candidatus Fonsibacter sp.]
MHANIGYLGVLAIEPVRVILEVGFGTWETLGICPCCLLTTRSQINHRNVGKLLVIVVVGCVPLSWHID